MINGQQEFDFNKPFDGSSFEPEFDQERLTGQMYRVFDCMKDGIWRTLSEIQSVTKDPESSISARLRNFRKHKFGSHVVNRKRRGSHSDGCWEYQLIVVIRCK